MTIDFRRAGADSAGRSARRGGSPASDVASSTPRRILVDATSGTVLATATGVYVAADEARKRQLQASATAFADRTTTA